MEALAQVLGRTDLFGGIGAIALVGLLGFLWRRYRVWRTTKARVEAARTRHKTEFGQGPIQRPVEPTAQAAWLAFGDVPQIPAPNNERPLQVRYCSFCKQSESRIRRFVAGDNANICEECVEKSLGRLETPVADRRAMVKRLQELTFMRESAANDHQTRESYRPEIDKLAMLLRRRRREGPGDVVANARLIRTVGAGNFSTVWEGRRVGRDNTDAGTVAVKIFDQDKLSLNLMIWRFQRGIRAMQHFHMLGRRVPKSIVSLVDIDEDLLSFSMPFLRGGDLQDLASRHLTIERRLQLFSQTCGAVRFAHDNGIIHRDIKPANVVLDAAGDAVLTDFDIADITFARTQSVMAGGLGTPQFAAPEQMMATSVEAHPTCDIYSLGKLLVFLLTQAPPPPGSIGPRESPDYLKSIQPARFRSVIRAALQHNPSNRPQSVEGLIELLN